jgi:hypothetical protein
MFVVFFSPQEEKYVWFKFSPFVDYFFASFTSICFCKCMFYQVLLHLFVVKFILVSFFFPFTMAIIPMKESYINYCNGLFGFLN